MRQFKVNPQKAGKPQSITNVRPYAGGSFLAPLVSHYSLMWEAIQRIAHPVGHQALKQFYNIR